VLVRDADEREQLAHTLAGHARGRVRELERQRNVGRDRARREQVRLLKHHADRPPRLGELRLAHGRELAAVDEHAARARTLQQVHAANQRALARARAPDHAERAPARHVKVDIVQGAKLVRAGLIHLVELLESNHAKRSRREPNLDHPRAPASATSH
jgi:hypothetical protein